MKKPFFFLFLLVFVGPIFAQTPYFQQDVAYKIHVKLDDQKHFLHANEEIIYTNNSPDALDKIVFHLWPNAYVDHTTEFGKQKVENGSLKFFYSDSEDRGFIDSLNFKIDGQAVKWTEYEGNKDIVELKLNQAIPPKGQVKITTPFRVKIPKSYSRLGHIGQQYQLCQWYPKPAVYDNKGWHPIPYLDQGEFYSEFGSFDVFIQVPKNYVVGATGDLPENDPELAWLAERETKSRQWLRMKKSEAVIEKEFPEGEYKTLHFSQKNVHDFAWFCDKEYYVLSQKVKLPESEREVNCVALFTASERQYWERCPEYIAKAVYYYSKWNGDYPYNHATAVDGALSAGAGMEYPNITVLGAGGSAENLEMVTMHEVGHNWYYGILGSNEREHPWMDEGLNTYFEGKYWQLLHGDSLNMIPKAIQARLGLNFSHSLMGREGYRLSASQGTDQAIDGNAGDYTSTNYGVIVYMKSGLAFNYLEAYLGEELTDKCFHAYYQKWKFKHPYPEDIQAVFEEVSGKDLDWFFNGYLNGTEKVDFRIKNRDENTFTIKNKTGIPLPASLSIMDENGNVVSTYWTEPFLDEAELTVKESNYDRAILNENEAIPEINTSNNLYKNKGFCKRSKPLSLDFLYKFPSSDKYHVGLLPTIAWNTTDGFMGGLLLYHNLFPEKAFSWHVNPMFGFKSSHLVGNSGFTYRWLPNNTFRKIVLNARISSYSTFLRVKPSLTFYLKKTQERNLFDHNFSFSSQILGSRSADQGIAPNDWYLPVYGAFNWQSKAHTRFSDFSADLELGGNIAEEAFRGSITANYSRQFLKKWKANLRGFAGATSSNGIMPYLLQYRLSGSNDPFGEQILFDRAGNTNWLSHQIVRDHGGFNSLTGISAEKGLLSINGSIRTPFKLISLFGDYGYVVNTQRIGNASYYDAGIRLAIMKDVLQVNIPVIGSVYGGLPTNGKALWQNINFSLAPLNLIDDIGSLISTGGN